MRYERELAIARDAAKRSAELALRHQRTGLTPETKPDNSPVTAADRECERLIASIFETAFPDDGFLGEEGARRESRSGRKWIVDPIDGTRDFVRGTPLWAVLIGLEEVGEVRAGVAHLPLLGYTCWATRGEGAWRNEERIRVSAIASPDSAVLSVNSLNRIAPFPFASRLLAWAQQFWAFRCLGGTPDAMMVAAGQIDLWIEPRVEAWDLAATQVILEEAGARFFDLHGHRTIYGGSAVACAPGLESLVRDFLAPGVD